ncbi:MAG: YwaF family protein [Acholeplasmataceae bacterium]|nr:YwaF family protein [Acholeplasmataceae bacterium]
MKDFIDYFWNNQGFEYDPTRHYLFGWYHIIMLVMMIVLFVLCWVIGNKMFRNKIKLWLRILAILLLALEILRVLNFYTAHHQTLFNSLSFHMCSVGIYIIIPAGIFNKKWLYDAAYIQGILGAPLAMIIPFGILPWWNEYSLIPLQSYVSHTLIIFVLCYAMFKGVWHVKRSRYLIAATSIIVSTFIIHMINVYKFNHLPGSSSNFFWTRYPDPLFPILNQVSPPYHIIILVALFLLFGYLCYLIGEIISKRRNHQIV